MKDKTSLVFTGDIGFDKYMNGKWNDPDLISKDVLNFLHSGDHVIANVEGALHEKETPGGTGGVAQLVHSMDPKAALVLDRMHADIWNLCNNHIMDSGPQGLASTLKEAAAHNAKTIGAGMNIQEAAKVLYLCEAGGIGMFACGFPKGCKPAAVNKAGTLLWNQMDVIQKNIDEIKSKCRWCIMVVHGGEEFTSLPSPYTRERYLKFLDMGADLIVAHHPHVPNNYETVGEKIIFYSLGNFIFDTDYQRAQLNTDRGILVKLNLTREKYSWEAMGIQIERGSERVIRSELPEIFENVSEKDYELLEPLAAKSFVENTKRQQRYLNPEKVENYTEEDWKQHFANPNRPGRIPYELLDFLTICPIAEKESEKAWKQSKLNHVKEYILSQL